MLLISGIGNQHDQVGRYLQAHPYAGAVGIFDDVVQDYVGPGPSISTTDFRHGNPEIAGGGILANEFVATPVEAWQKLTAAGLVPTWGKESVEAMKQLYSRVVFVMGPLQQVPNPESRVGLAALRDAAGMPVAQLPATDLHPTDVRGMHFLSERAAEWLAASGARTVRVLRGRTRQANAGQHQAGTARMGTDPASSVTDVRGRVWGQENVSIADGSLHVTNGGVNPVLTIMALAWRVAQGMAEQLS